MRRVTVYLDPQLHRLLALVAKRTRTTISALIRETLDERFVKRSGYRERTPKRAPR